MKLTIKGPITAGLIFIHTVLTLYGASDEIHSEPLMLTGICANKRGNYIRVSSYEHLDTKKEAFYTIVYSEHNVLKSNEKLALIAERIVQASCETDSKGSLYWQNLLIKIDNICKKETTPYTRPAITDEVSTVVDLQDERPTCTLLATFLKVTAKKVHHAGCHYVPTGLRLNGQGAYRLKTCSGRRLATKLLLRDCIPILYTDIITDPQAEAEKLQLEVPDAPFYFVVNLNKWRKLIAPEEPKPTTP